MTKEQCSLQPNYYGSSCDFQDLQSAVQQLTTKSDAQFEELKNEKWFHRIFNMVVCPRKNNIRMAEQITSLAQAQGILIEILVRLADQDANIAGMVMQSQSDIRALAQNSAYLQERLYLLEDKSYGIKENENLKDLNSQQRNILSGCLNEASKLYAMPSNEQRLYANELLNYLNADAQVANLEDALDDLEDNAKRKILSCIITYMYLYDHTAESMEQDEQEDFIDLFDLGRKSPKKPRLKWSCRSRRPQREHLKHRPKKMEKKPLTRMRPVKNWCCPALFRMMVKRSTRIKKFTFRLPL